MFIDRGTKGFLGAPAERNEMSSLRQAPVRTFRSAGAGAISSGERSINIPSLRDWGCVSINLTNLPIPASTNLPAL